VPRIAPSATLHPAFETEADEIGKTPVDLVSFSATAPQILAKNRETAFVSRRLEFIAEEIVWRELNSLAQTLCQGLI
jgi:hypothetical protein